jgi:hypothetical protein
MSKRKKNRHLFIPDPQVKEGVPLEHLTAAGNYIVAKQPEVIVCIGDFADMPSLSFYDVGKMKGEGTRVMHDLEAAKKGMDLLLNPMREYNAKRAANKKKQYKPRMVMTLGNHEYRIQRHIENNPQLEGVLSMDMLPYEDWEVVPFLEIIEIDGIKYSHYFINPHSLTKSVVGGMIETKLKNLGWSFSMGHQQTTQYGMIHLGNGERRQGLVSGSFYQHDEAYMGPQGNASHWRGMVMKNEVKDGRYDPCFLSMEYLLERWL